MRIAIMQQPFSVADLNYNLRQILAFCAEARQNKAELALTPFMSLTGFPLFDLNRHDFIYEAVAVALKELSALADLGILLSYPVREQNCCFIRRALLFNGKFLFKQDFAYNNLTVSLPPPVSINFHNVTFIIANAADIDTVAVPGKADAVILESATPFYDTVFHDEAAAVTAITKKTALPVLALNMLGADDQYIFAGGSKAVNKDGVTTFQAGYFAARNYFITFNPAAGFTGVIDSVYGERIELLYRAICFSMQRYFAKTGFKKVCLGLSGGIDSALVLALSVAVVGAENCEVFLLPSQYTRDISNDYALTMARNLGVKHTLIPITPVFTAFLQSLDKRFAGLGEDKTEENIQARTRGVLLMALSNKTGAILLCTCNKSEEATGYGTLYGDTNGGFAPLKDLLKTEVYAMANWLNKNSPLPLILPEIITRAPSAELKNDQTDQDTLPEYPLLDAIIKLILVNKSFEAIVASGFDPDTVRRVMTLVRANEFKRQQGACGPQLSRRSFGREWNYPVTNLPDNF